MQPELDASESVQRALALARHNWRFVLKTTLATAALVFLFTLFMRPIFRAESTLLVSVNRAKLSVSPETTARSAPPPQVTEEDLNSVVAMLGKRELVKQALQAHGVPEGSGSGGGLVRNEGLLRTIFAAPIAVLRGLYFALHGQTRPPAFERQVDAIARKLEVIPVRRSNVIEVGMQDSDPAWASDFVNGLVGEFLKQYARTYDPTNAEAFFDEQSRLLSARLQESEDALRQFRDRSGIVSLDDQRRGVVSSLGAAQTDRDRVAVDLASSRARLNALNAAVSHERALIPVGSRQSQTVPNHIRSRLASLEMKRSQLLENYMPESERIRDIDAQIATARSILNDSRGRAASETEMGINKTHETLSVERALEQTQVAVLDARLRALDNQIESLRTRSRDFDSHSVEGERLERDRAMKQEAYRAYVQQAEAARLANALNQSQILNVSVASPAAVPASPIRPRIWVNLLIGAALGFFLGVVFAAIRESLQRSTPTVASSRPQNFDVLAVVP